VSVQTVVVRQGRIIALTELFMLRCDSFLNHLAIVGKIGEWEILGDEWDVVNYLALAGEIREVKNDYNEFYFTPTKIVNGNHPGAIDPTVLSLAEENPANANFIRVYRKNQAAAKAA
jgi:hypothetical protein